MRPLTTALDALSEEDRRFVISLRNHSPAIAIATAADLISRFTAMVKDKTPTLFDGWPREAEASALGPFAAGSRWHQRITIGSAIDDVQPTLL